MKIFTSIILRIFSQKTQIMNRYLSFNICISSDEMKICFVLHNFFNTTSLSTESCQVWCRPQNLLGIFDYRSETVIRCDINKYAKLLFVHGSFLSSVQHMFGDKHFWYKKKDIVFEFFNFFLWMFFGVKALLHRDILRILQNFTSREIILFMKDVG